MSTHHDTERYYTPLPFTAPQQQELTELHQTVAALRKQVALLESELRLWCGGLLPGEKMVVDGEGCKVVK